MNKFQLVALSMLLILSSSLSAGVIDDQDVTIGSSTFKTFKDDTTSLVWLDLNSFWDGTTTYNSLTSLLVGSGFRLATLTELSALQLSIPAVPANFAAEVVIVGGNNVSRNLIWGIYEDGDSTDGVSYSWKFDTDTAWQFGSNAVSASDVFSLDNPTEKDLGAWIVADVTPALPVSALNWRGIAVLIALLGGFAFYRGKKPAI